MKYSRASDRGVLPTGESTDRRAQPPGKEVQSAVRNAQDRGDVLEALQTDLKDLRMEFNRLEMRVRHYLDQC